MDNISTVEPPTASTLNFQQPKLIQISVNDVGACIPLLPMVRSEHYLECCINLCCVYRLVHHLTHRKVNKVNKDKKSQDTCVLNF